MIHHAAMQQRYSSTAVEAESLKDSSRMFQNLFAELGMSPLLTGAAIVAMLALVGRGSRRGRRQSD
jgi:hypothetical protein